MRIFTILYPFNKIKGCYKVVMAVIRRFCCYSLTHNKVICYGVRFEKGKKYIIGKFKDKPELRRYE